MRVVFVDYVLVPDQPGRTGLSDIVWDMAIHLRRLGVDAHIVAAYTGGTVPAADVPVHGFPIPPMGYRNIVGNAWLLNRAVDVVQSLRPDIVHVPEYVSSMILAARQVRPVVLTVPGNIYQKLSVPNGSGYEWYFGQVLKLAARVSARHCSVVVATSNEMKHWWVRTGSRPEATPVIPLGVDIERFRRIPEARKQLAIGEESRMLLYVGRYSREKGVLDLVESVRRASSELGDNFTLYMRGDGPLRDVLKTHVSEGGLDSRIKVLDWCRSDELAVWYSAADAVVMPSRSEAFGRVMAEALCCSTPVIATDVGGMSDWIVDGRNGFLVPWGDVDKLSLALCDFVRDASWLKGARWHLEQHNIWRKEFGWEHICRTLVERVYSPLVYGTGAAVGA
jgi:glycosyltransferase involved in cell wall biosynthesis